MVPSEDLDRRFASHPPEGTKGERHDAIRNNCRVVAGILNEALPDSREKSLALTHLEEVMFWSNAAIAREGK